MEQLQVPTRRIHVEVFITSGAEIHGSLFVHDSPYHSGTPEDVIHLLNDERDFLPLSVEDSDSGPYVVNKTHIVHVRLPFTGEDRQDRIGLTAPVDAEDCTLYLTSGVSLKGTLVIDSPSNSARVVDKLNLASTFVPVVTADGMEFVRRSHVVHVS